MSMPTSPISVTVAPFFGSEAMPRSGSPGVATIGSRLERSMRCTPPSYCAPSSGATKLARIASRSRSGRRSASQSTAGPEPSHAAASTASSSSPFALALMSAAMHSGESSIPAARCARVPAAGTMPEDSAVEPLGKRVRNGKVDKLPYVLVVGDDDVANDTVGVNRRGEDRPERDVDVADFIARLGGEVETKS